MMTHDKKINAAYNECTTIISTGISEGCEGVKGGKGKCANSHHPHGLPDPLSVAWKGVGFGIWPKETSEGRSGIWEQIEPL